MMSDSLQTHGLQHARLPCPSLSPGACSNSCPLSQWCHPNSSSSVTLFSSHLQSFPASESFPVSQLFASGSQNTGASALALVLLMIIQGWFPLGLTDLISLLSNCLNYVLNEYLLYFDWTNSSFLVFLICLFPYMLSKDQILFVAITVVREFLKSFYL